MSLTAKLVRVVRNAGTDADSDANSEETYECKDCGASFDLDRQTCPDCGGFTIDRIDWDGVVSE